MIFGFRNKTESKDGMYFTEFRAFPAEKERKEFLKRKFIEREFCLLLPSKFKGGGEFDSKFTLITDRWRVLRKDGRVGMGFISRDDIFHNI